jgi:predicted nucleic acid-binding protein
MTKVFADAHYWVALINNQDQSHAAAQAVSITLQAATIVTTEEALTEVLAFFSERGRYLRELAASTVRNLYVNSMTLVLPQSRQTFLGGLALYQARPDKGYSLTDCISMQTMRKEGLTEVLTNDRHFEQEGFRALFRE